MSGAASPGTSAPTGPAGSQPVTSGPRRHQSYEALYSDDTIHPAWAPAYQTTAGVWEHTPAAITGTELAAQLKTHQDTIPMAFLGVFGDGSTMGEVRVLHQPKYYSPPLGVQPVADLHDKMYALYDDLGAGNFVPHIRFPAAYLDVLGPIRVPTETTLTQTSPFPDRFGPYPTASAEVEDVHLRKTCWVPPRVAALVLGSRDRSVAAVAKLLDSNISAFTEGGSWNKLRLSLLVWIRAAMTVSAQGVSLMCLPAPEQAPMDRNLIDFRWRCVTSDLPTLGSGAIQSGAEQISAAIGAGVTAYTDAREEERRRAEAREREKAGTVRKKFAHCMTPLLRLTQQTVPEDVTTVWHELAKVGAKHHRSTLQSAMNENAQLLRVKPPTVSPLLSGILADPTQWRTDTYDVELHQGWTLWGCLARERRGKSAESRRARAYDLATRLGSTVSHSDVEKFLEVESGFTVPSPAHIIETMEHNMVIAHTMLGEDHSVTRAFQQITTWMVQHNALMTEKWLGASDSIWWPTAVVFYFHKELSCWVNYQLDSSDPVAAPNFMGWTHKLQINDQWHRGLPTQLSIDHIGSDEKSQLSGLTAGTGLTDLTGNSDDSATRVSKGGDTGTDWSKGTLMSRGDANPKLAEFKTHSVSYQEMIKAAKAANDPIPTDDNGVPFCLSYHLRGQCYDNCGRHKSRKDPSMVSNHRSLSDSEAGRLAKWCKSHYK